MLARLEGVGEATIWSLVCAWFASKYDRPMTGIRALQRRIKRIEEAEKPKPSPFTVMFGSFDAWVEQEVLLGIESGALGQRGMVAVVAALRRWEQGGVWENAFAF